MSLISKPYTFSAGTTILSAEVNSDFDTIYSEINGNITDSNISASAAISTTKISGTVMTRTANETVTGNKTFTGVNEFNTGALTIASDVTISGIITATGVFAGATPIILEGATANAFETTFSVTDPTVDRTLTIPNENINLGQQCTKGWVNFNGTGVVAIRDSFNVTSITDNGTGNYTVNWTTSFANANYSVSGIAGGATGTPSVIVVFDPVASPIATGSVTLEVRNSTSGAQVDKDYVTVMAIGDL